MKYGLIVRKLYLDGEKYIRASRLREYSKTIGMKYEDVIRYLIANKYLHRIMRGVFYLPSIEERKLKKIEVSVYGAISKAMEIKGVKNWYFGLESAMKLNNLTHEYFATEYVISDTIFRARAYTILGTKVKFLKLKRRLTDFGIIRKNNLSYSGPEKTMLDVAYLARYGGLKDAEIKSKVSDILPRCSKKTLLSYAKNYNNSILEFVKTL